jgi:hypothetical protein
VWQHRWDALSIHYLSSRCNVQFAVLMRLETGLQPEKKKLIKSGTTELGGPEDWYDPEQPGSVCDDA